MPSGAIVARCHHNSCDYEWSDFRKHYEPGAYERRERNGWESRADSSDSSDSFSKERYSVRTPRFPIDALPAGCARYVREAAASLRCAPELVGVPVLAALSGVIGYTAVVRIKTGWLVSGNIYAAVVDAPGSRKSPAAGLAYRPLEKLQGMLRKAHKQELETFERDMREHAVRKKRAAKEDQPEPDPPVRPKMRRCIVDDITVEALATRLEQNPRGFLSAHDELTGFIKGLDQYKSGGKGNARQAYLKMWSNNAIYVARKGSDEPVVVPNAYVTLQGAIQPSVLGEIGAGRDDGFLDRFIFAYPEPHGGGYSEESVSAQAELTYENVIGSLWDKQPAGEDEADEIRPRVVRMDPEAKELFIEAANNLATEMHAVGFPEVLRGPWSKLDTQLARLALIIAVTRSEEEDAQSERVTRSDMRNALRLLDYFKATTRKVYGQLFEANPDDVLAADLVTLLTQSQYVFSGTISQLSDALESAALPDTPEALGKAIRRIVKSSPDLSLKSKSTGKERIITITLEKPSEPSDDDSEEDAHRERVRESW
jgi:putative DNA primase/helicase